jgi:nucleoid DNA-binding protein
MNPTKIKDLSETVSAQTGVDKEEVERILNVFYKDFVREKLSMAEELSYYIPNFGNFSVSKNKIPGLKIKIQNQLNNIFKKEDNFLKNNGLKSSIEKPKQKLIKILENLDLLEKKKQDEETKRKEYKQRLINKNYEQS